MMPSAKSLVVLAVVSLFPLVGGPPLKPIYLDPGQPVDARVADLLARMILAEKIGQMNMPPIHILGNGPTGQLDGCRKFVAGTLVDGVGPGGGIFGCALELAQEPRRQAEGFNEFQKIATGATRLRVPLLWTEEGTHGLWSQGGTLFPEGPGIGSSWNPDLVERVYGAAASEARAIGIHQLCTLVIEPNRDPRLGRNEETFSEDPFMCSRFAEALVHGIQGKSVSAPDRVVAVLCHYPGQSQPISGMERGSMDISERTLREVFLPPWVSGIRRAGALGVMATYPAIGGEPVHGSERLLTQVLRGELGFRGIVLSEGGGFFTLIHDGVAADQKQAGRMALGAGVDVNTSYEPAYLGLLAENVREGKVPMALIDRAVRRILRQKFVLGLFENPYVDPLHAERSVHSQAHRELALEAARESIVLLKNDKGLLPLRKDLRRIVVIGPNADDQRNQIGDFTSGAPTQDIVTVLRGIQRKVTPATEVVYVKGCNVKGTAVNEIGKAREAARGADVAVVVIGENARYLANGKSNPEGTVGEARDVASLDLTGSQEELVQTVHETGTPTVVVLINGRALSIRWIAEYIPAIVEAWVPGEQGGDAVADILFGDYNPSGRLPVTFPRHSGQLPVYYNYDGAKLFSQRRGYADMSYKPLWEFGYGLSYTNFAYGGLRIEPARVARSGTVRVSLDVKNMGTRAGQEVVQLYIRDVVASVPRPVKELRGFEKVLLASGENRRVSFALTPEDLAVLDRNWKPVVEPGTFEVMVGNSSEQLQLKGSFEVVP